MPITIIAALLTGAAVGIIAALTSRSVKTRPHTFARIKTQFGDVCGSCLRDYERAAHYHATG